ncbi:beta-1,3-galactosyltransferase 1-like [Saccoglossus kowalevskii]|uniref:Hexosyltransferase n=1 Tax=Saccoglossus kowalevskii TaxID=10224 RepID=A0ABM0GVN2_SACKO|nr:PREDICTED: beta-1,3-galactosyltransferase 1-like [Saccoglossus kowalevskii]
MAIKDRLFVRLLILSLLPLLNLCLYVYFIRSGKPGGDTNDKSDKGVSDFSRQLVMLLGNETSTIDESFNWSNKQVEIEACNRNTSCLLQYLHNSGFPTDLKFILSNPYKCERTDVAEADIFLLVLITSRVANFERRATIRQTWGGTAFVASNRVATMFLLGNDNNDKLRKMVRHEKEQFDDIIMGDFVDSYHNLTLKSIMGLKWARYYCPKAKYVLKTDDDVFVNYVAMVNFLLSSNRSDFAVGYVYLHESPNRNASHKWFMSPELFPSNEYPPFCSGTGYVMSSDVLQRTYDAALQTPLLPLEDVYVGVCWEKIGIVPRSNPGFRVYRQKLSACIYSTLLTIHAVSVRETRQIWNFVQTRFPGGCREILDIRNIFSPIFEDSTDVL